MKLLLAVRVMILWTTEDPWVGEEGRALPLRVETYRYMEKNEKKIILYAKLFLHKNPNVLHVYIIQKQSFACTFTCNVYNYFITASSIIRVTYQAPKVCYYLFTLLFLLPKCQTSFPLVTVPLPRPVHPKATPMFYQELQLLTVARHWPHQEEDRESTAGTKTEETSKGYSFPNNNHTTSAVSTV